LVKLAGGDPTDHRAAAGGLPPIDSIDVWPFLSDITGKTPSPRVAFPVDSNCVIDGDWKLITSATSPDGWQGPKYPNSTSMLDGYSHSEWIGEDDDGYLPRHQHDRIAWELDQDTNGGANGATPRPYPRLEECDAGKNETLAAMQKWEWTANSNEGTVCTKAPKFSSNPCFNVQGGHTTDRIILWPKGSEKNDLYALSNATGLIRSAINGDAGCVGAPGLHGELVLVDNCQTAHDGMLTHGWAYDGRSGQISIASAADGMLCVTAGLNGTKPGPKPKKGPCSGGCLFNVSDLFFVELCTILWPVSPLILSMTRFAGGCGPN
jgi:hypothetical protein